MREEGKVVLFRFPRANLKEGKLRPALVLKQAPGKYTDWLICMISSQIHQRIDGFDQVITEKDPDYTSQGLKARAFLE